MKSEPSPSGQRNNFIGFIALIIILLVGYFLFGEEKKTALEIESEMIWVSDNSIQAPRIPYIPQIQVLGSFSYDSEIMKYSWSPEIMTYILNCESGGNPEAINWEDKHKGCNGSFGLFQVACIHFDKYGLDNTNWQDANTNIDTAYQIWLLQGYSAWYNCYTRYLSTL